MDLYIMGLLAPEDVTPTYLIAEPDTMGQRDRNGQRINPGSTPEFGDRTISIRGRRVNFGIDDIIRANGPRIPAAVTVAPTRAADGGVIVPPDGGAMMDPRENDLDVVWVLLTTSDRVGDRVVRDFDRAVDECADGYSYATDGRSVLLPRVAPPPVVDAGPDAATDASATTDTATDAGADAATDGGPGFTLGGGCACRATPAAPDTTSRRALSLCAALGALACAQSARRRRARRRA
jgi:hypothetical protein